MGDRSFSAHGFEFQLVQKSVRGGIRRGIGNQLYGKQIGADILRISVRVERIRPWMDFVRVEIRRLPLNVRGRGCEGLSPPDTGSITVDQIGIVRDIRKDLEAGGSSWLRHWGWMGPTNCTRCKRLPLTVLIAALKALVAAARVFSRREFKSTKSY